ncbi:MAG TPA: hypothetical protein VI653_12405 [Steroidobacteraceae bacterium]
MTDDELLSALSDLLTLLINGDSRCVALTAQFLRSRSAARATSNTSSDAI